MKDRYRRTLLLTERKQDRPEERAPKANVIPNIIRLSNSSSYEDARNEWSLVDIIGPDSADFKDHCDICNTPLHKLNCILRNEVNSKEIKVGSHCIRRFIILAGLGSKEATVQYMNNLEHEWDTLQELRLMYRSVVQTKTPHAADLSRFHRRLTRLLTQRGQFPLPDNCRPHHVIPILQTVFGINEVPPTSEIYMLFQILYDPKRIAVIRDHKRFYNPRFTEGSTMNKKGSKVTHNTLANSRIYAPESSQDGLEPPYGFRRLSNFL